MGDVKIGYATSEKDKAWDSYVMRSKTATFFHTTGWRRVIEKSFGYHPHYLYAENGSQITGILPLFFTESLLFGRALISVPFAVYGGVDADDAVTVSALTDEAGRLAVQLRVKYAEYRHIEPVCTDLTTKRLYVAFQREILSDVDENMKLIPRKQRRMIRQGAKYGLTSKVGGREDLDSFYAVYTHSLRNLGTPAFPYGYFRSLFSEFSDACRILSIWREEKMIAGVLTFFFKDWVMPYYGGALKDAFRYAVNDAMYWALMCYACEKDFRIFDFGRSREGSGSYRFKRHWGFTPRPLHYQYALPEKGELPNFSPDNSKFKSAIALWKCLPLPVANVIGPRLIRFFP